MSEWIGIWVSGLSDRDLLRLWAAPTKGLSIQRNKKIKQEERKATSVPLVPPSQACVLSDATFRLGPMIFNLGLKSALGAMGGGPSGLWSQAEGVEVIPWVSQASDFIDEGIHQLVLQLVGSHHYGPAQPL